ncbi:IBR domain protein [Ectocarpus siliculosus]|uniref:IBR domain protein n=1 Tax=Ectocarpus siliculosus TaxID=2880 RepID=D7FWK9_ECTSI|nr:IBR domain protein [Ectocarpus siliculosus]|eukprot:CBJ32097.1 IBR domain protein [Ectocarpus siliculosus]
MNFKHWKHLNARKQRLFYIVLVSSVVNQCLLVMSTFHRPVSRTDVMFKESLKVARFYCAYCMRNQPGTSRRRFEGNGGCSHEFCKACLEDYLFQRIMVGHHSLHPCPKFGEESCRSSATRNDVRRIVRAEVYEEHRRRLEGLSGACEECGRRGRRPSSPSSPHVPSPPSPLLSAISRRASAAAADSHEEDAGAGANEDNTCQSCGSTRRRHHHHHHHHHQSHRQKRHPVPRDAATAGAARTAPGGGAGRKGRKGFAWSPRWSPHGRAPSLDRTATGGDDESGQRRNKQPDKRQQQEQQQKRGGLSPEAAAASAADPPEVDEKSATGAGVGAGDKEAEGAASAAGTHAAGLRHRTCPTCGAHRRQSPRGSRVKAPVDPNDEEMTTATMPTSTPAAASETATARRRRGSDMTDNLVLCLGCGEAWCLLCGGPVSTAETAADGVSSGGGGRGGGGGGGYRRTRTDPKEGRGCDGQGERERGTGYAVSTGGVVPRGHVRHFSRWNVAGCPGARYTDPMGWKGEFITLYRALVAILVFLVGPLFFFLRGVCLLVETLLAPLCCGAFGGASRPTKMVIVAVVAGNLIAMCRR